MLLLVYTPKSCVNDRNTKLHRGSPFFFTTMYTLSYTNTGLLLTVTSNTNVQQQWYYSRHLSGLGFETTLGLTLSFAHVHKWKLGVQIRLAKSLRRSFIGTRIPRVSEMRLCPRKQPTHIYSVSLTIGKKRKEKNSKISERLEHGSRGAVT